jgi:hypothetical protein
MPKACGPVGYETGGYPEEFCRVMRRPGPSQHACLGWDPLVNRVAEKGIPGVLQGAAAAQDGRTHLPR